MALTACRGDTVDDGGQGGVIENRLDRMLAFLEDREAYGFGP